MNPGRGKEEDEKFIYFGELKIQQFFYDLSLSIFSKRTKFFFKEYRGSICYPCDLVAPSLLKPIRYWI